MPSANNFGLKNSDFQMIHSRRYQTATDRQANQASPGGTRQRSGSIRFQEISTGAVRRFHYHPNNKSGGGFKFKELAMPG